MIDPPFFSLIVPTIERAEEVDMLLSSIARSEFRSFEVILVDQNLDDRLDPIVAKYHDCFQLKHLRIQSHGAARARNYGAKHARGRFLNFPDDDCELPETLLGDAFKLITGKSLLVLSGMCIDREGGASTARFAADDKYLHHYNLWGRCIECTMFIERESFNRVDGYDELFGVGSVFGSDEGPELLHRLISTLPKGTIFYSHQIRFYHPVKVVIYDQSAASRAYNYARGSGALLAKRPSLHLILHSCNIMLRYLVAIVIFTGSKRKYYFNRTRGFISGFFDYHQRRL